MSDAKKPEGKKLRRFDMKKLLANPELRKNLVVRSTVATQAREGIDITEKQAETSYYVVTEGERAAFFGLQSFRCEAGENDGRHVEFVRSHENPSPNTRIDVSLRDFAAIQDSPLAFDKVGLLGNLFRSFPKLDPSFCDAKQGLISTESERFVRVWWETNGITDRRWVPYAKGGDFSRFYSDIYLRFDWTDDGAEIKAIAKERYGSASRTIKCEEYYFRPGLTWVEKTIKGINVRILPPGAIFNVAGPSAFPHRKQDTDYLLGILNSSISQAFLNCFATRSWGVEYVGRVPIPINKGLDAEVVSKIAKSIFHIKSNWDTGNEISTRFDRPWVLQPEVNHRSASLSSALDAVLDHEAELDAELQTTYAELNDAVYRLYGVNDALRIKIEAAIGQRPPEIVWPQMEGRDRDQKRREHVDRLLCYLVKRVVEADEDGIVCLQRVFHEPPLIERLRHELAACFPGQDPNALETEVVNELKKKTKGYRRAESLAEWLHDAFFEIHNALYLQRPLLWHLASNQIRTEPGFACLVHAHRFSAEGLAKLRSFYVRDRITTLRRESAQAGQDNKEAERIELLALAEEVEEYDTKLKLLQEGAHTGPEGGDRDYRILTPWKQPADRPQGWTPDLDDGIKVNLAPLARTNLLRRKLKLGEAKEED